MKREWFCFISTYLIETLDSSWNSENRRKKKVERVKIDAFTNMIHKEKNR